MFDTHSCCLQFLSQRDHRAEVLNTAQTPIRFPSRMEPLFCTCSGLSSIARLAESE